MVHLSILKLTIASTFCIRLVESALQRKKKKEKKRNKESALRKRTWHLS
jgi:hypothetical protein